MVKRLLFGALLCAFVHCFSSYKCLHHGGLTLHRLHAVQDLPNGVSKDEDDWFYDTEDLEIIEENLLRLKEEVKKKKVILDAAELAVRRTRELLLKRKPTFGSCDYGYSVFEHNTTNEETVPRSAIRLGTSNFIREGQNLIRRRSGNDKVDPAVQKNRDLIKQLTLSNDAIWKREDARPRVKAPWVIRIPYLVLCNLLDVFFEGDPMSRFFFLETVARMPYFSYITMLHTYETLGWWRRSAETKRVHFAEEMNEYHHLLIMESLGGSQEWRTRFLAQHASIVYYFALILMWVLSPSLAYNFSELIEAHAVDTYGEFAEANKELLMNMPPPRIALEYYEADDMYVFDEFQTSRAKGSRRPDINNLYDVFCTIRDDESEHVKTMAACQDPDTLVRSPNTEAAIFAAATVSILLGVFLSSGNVASVDESTVAADTLQGAWNGFNLDTLIEGVAGGAAMTKGLTESAAADAAAAGEGATSMAAEGILGQLSRIISSLKYLISAP